MEVEKGGIKVIGAGLPRTATSSLQAALQVLGYKPCHHMVSDVLSDVNGRGQRWLAAWDTQDKGKRQTLIREILSHYQATVDFPGSLFVDDLIDMYPEAKVVLGLRSSPEVWRQSFKNTLDLTMTPWWYSLTFMLPSTRFLVLHAAPRWEKLNKERYNTQVYGTASTDIYGRHNDWVRSVVPKERLLEFEPGQGWEPLCDFLGKPVPATPYPHTYETKEIRKWFLVGAEIGFLLWIVIGVMFAAVCYGIVLLMAKVQSGGRSEL